MPAKCGGHEVIGRHPGYCREIHPLNLVELGGNQAGAHDVDVHAGAFPFGVQVWEMATWWASVPA